MKVLSICIPTYNRVEQLKELITSLLSVKSEEFEVVVTNNCSTDSTLAVLDRIKDDRLVVHSNQSPEPALYNMIVSIFNATGKYALYCNDRDIIFTERLLPFIEFLKCHEYSYLHIAKSKGHPTYKLTEYEKGFDSLLHHPFSDHPTGMVFNVMLMKKFLNKEHFKSFINETYTFCYLKREVVVYEMSAEYDNYLWDERSSAFKVQSASGSVHKGQLFFDKEKTIDYMKGVVKHLIGNPYFSLSLAQQKELLLNIFVSYTKRLMWEKHYYADKRECIHYGIKPRFISYFEMKDSYKSYFKECDNTLRVTGFYDELIDTWNKKKKELLNSLLSDCFRYDKNTLITRIKRALDPQYRY